MYCSRALVSAVALAFLTTGCPTPTPPPATDTGLVPVDGGGIEGCLADDDCQDELFCNGREQCRPADPESDGRGCVDAIDAACLASQTCDEAMGICITDCAVTRDADGDGADATICGGMDCDDAEATVYPGAPELCDAIDQDCDPSTLGERDVDGDGERSSFCCNAGVCGVDCMDTERSVSSTSIEVCNGFDDDCDGRTDEGVLVSGFLDADGDLHGDPGVGVMSCAGVGRFSTIGDDCDDANPAKHGGQPEVCNALDDDCDGAVDENTSAVDWFVDEDGDGFGTALGEVRSSCIPLSGRSLLSSDCDDRAVSVHPGASEACNAVDDDCNGRIDFHLGRNDLEDDDLDGAADARCATGLDCDDGDPTIFPEAIELTGLGDNDCDGLVDEGCSGVRFYVDADGDGWGTGTGTTSCTVIVGSVTREGDCDDTDADVQPGAKELCNAVDDDCDGAIDRGADRLCDDDDSLGVCTAGTCAISVCVSGLGDCDSMASTGCEDDLGSDALNCGGCGLSCPAPTGARRVPVCIAGRCGGVCAVGYGDCDGDATNGCEADLSSDDTHCGTCATMCGSRPHASGSCASGGCDFVCDIGWGDCDGNPMTGCETPTYRDRAHCGSCSGTCDATALCLDSICTSAPPERLDSNGSEGALLVRAGEVMRLTGLHQYTTITVETGGSILGMSPGTLDLRATGDVVIDGTIDVSGGDGGFGSGGGATTQNGGGGVTGDPMGDGTSASMGRAPCVDTGSGGPGPRGTDGAGTTASECGHGSTGGGNGGMGAGGPVAMISGGGGGGCGGGGGGTDYQAGAPPRWGGNGGTCGAVAALGARTDGTYREAEGGGIGAASTAYRGGGGHCCAFYIGGGGAGGSIGAPASLDLAVAESTFYPGSGGGGGGGGYPRGGSGGGGGGGALRIASRTSIVIRGVIRANGGAGGDSPTEATGGGGGGSGGLVFLAAPTLTVDGSVTAIGGPGGELGSPSEGGGGGIGRIRISSYTELCTLRGSFDPPLSRACTPSSAIERTYVGRYPN